MTLKDFPKLHCPFIRKTYEVDFRDWKKYGSLLGLRAPEVYLVTPEINPECSWVFENDDVYAVEKLHGTNLLIEVKDSRLVYMQNRLNEVDFTKVIGKKNGLPPSARYLEGVLHAAELDYLEDNKVQYGELIGPRLNGNLHQLNKHLWYPFNRARVSLRYKSFNKYPKEFWGWSEWFRTSLKSILYCRMNKIPLHEMFSREDVPFTEGVVLYKDGDNPDKAMMSKLRRDMLPWYYWDKIEIKGLEEHWLRYGASNHVRIKGYTESIY